jgi:hypothetical protein
VVILAVEVATTITDPAFAVVVAFFGEAVVILAVEVATTITDPANVAQETL